jgi:hypothetical protein
MNKKKSSWFAKKNSLDKSCRKSQNTEAKEYAHYTLFVNMLAENCYYLKSVEFKKCNNFIQFKPIALSPHQASREALPCPQG